jgi:WD40 repeat protein
VIAIFVCRVFIVPNSASSFPFGIPTRQKQEFALELKTALPPHQHKISLIAFSPEGHFLITAAYRERTSKLWNTASNRLIAELDGTIDLEAYHLYHHQSPSFFTPDEKTLVTVRGVEAKLWDAETGKLKLTLTGHEKDICSVAFSSDGQLLATGAQDGKVNIWGAATGKLISTFEVWHVKKIARWRVASRYLNVPIAIYLSFSPDGQTILTTVDWEASPAKLWAVGSGRLIATFGGHTENWGTPAPVRKALFSVDGRFIATESFAETRIWDAATGTLKQSFRSYSDAANISPDGKLIGPLKKGEVVGLFDTETAEVRIPLAPTDLFAGQVVFSPDTRTAAVNGTIIDIADRRVSATIPFVYKRGRFILEPEDYVTDIDFLSFHPNGKILMAANRNSVRFWEMPDGQLVVEKTDMRIPATFSPDGRLLAMTAKDKKTVLLWLVNLP